LLLDFPCAATAFPNSIPLWRSGACCNACLSIATFHFPRSSSRFPLLTLPAR
jgi:hypothetical protein